MVVLVIDVERHHINVQRIRRLSHSHGKVFQSKHGIKANGTIVWIW
jgi:hypothetical protein